MADGETMLQHALPRCSSVGYALHLQSLSDDAFSAVLGCATLPADALNSFVQESQTVWPLMRLRKSLAGLGVQSAGTR